MTVLADTSIWIDHFRGLEPGLGPLLKEASVLTHPFVLGELACGNLTRREITMGLLNALPAAISAQHEEVLRMLEAGKLWGIGIGWVDMHLIASSLLSNCALWTRDERLRKAAARAGVTRFLPPPASH